MPWEVICNWLLQCWWYIFQFHDSECTTSQFLHASLSFADWYINCQTCNISCTSIGNKIVHHSDVVGASPVGTSPTTSSFSTEHLASMDWAKAITRRDENHLNFGTLCALYWRFYSIFNTNYWISQTMVVWKRHPFCIIMAIFVNLFHWWKYRYEKCVSDVFLRTKMTYLFWWPSQLQSNTDTTVLHKSSI